MDQALIIQLLGGLLLGGVIGLAAWRAGALSGSGGWAAAVCGGLIFGLGGWEWAVLLLAFFISSSGLSRAFSQRKAALNEKFSKGSRRDWAQVLANGGLGALLALIHAWRPEWYWPWLAFGGAMAAVNADTWATELGVLSRVAPRLITNGATVERGTSGGVSLAGSLAALSGGLLIGGLMAIFPAGGLETARQAGGGAPGLLAAASLGGLAGSFFDSLLGATLQAIYTCPVCQKETEKHPRHSCGSVTVWRRGWRWLNNDWVNFACSAVGALAALLIWSALAA